VRKEDVTADQLRLVVDRQSDGLILFDREGICLYLNPEAVRIVGKPPEEVIGKHIGEAVPDAMSTVCEGARERLIAGEEVLAVRSYFAQGRWFEVLGRPLGGDFLVHFHDITERLQAESARRQSEERFEILVNGVKDYCLIMLDPKGIVASWNLAAERITGYKAEEVLGKPLATLYPARLVESGEPRRRLEMAVRHGSFTGERWFVRKDGSRFLAHSTYTCLVDELGTPSGFAIVAQDITEQRRMEESLRASEERLRLAVEAGGVGTWEEIVGSERVCGDRRFLALCGLPPDHQPSIEEFLAIVHPEDRDYFQQKRKRLLEADEGYEFEFEYRVSGRAGRETRWVECHGAVLNAGGESRQKRIIGVLRDATRRHEADEFRQLAAGVIAHDLRSPLSAVKLTSQTLLEHEALPQRAFQKVQLVVRNVDRMVKMLEWLLAYTQTEFGGGLSLEKGFTDLEQICRDAISDVQTSRPDSEICFKAEGDCRGVWDRTRLTEVAVNLVGNALKHGEPGQPIHVLARDEGEQIALYVHNSGPPIPNELIPVIFEPFRRAENQGGSIEGSFGLGLYIVREIIAAHDGTVEVSSSLAEGTTFIVHLPRGEEAHPAHSLA
jgi:PAS domain S-box-containing protein